MSEIGKEAAERLKSFCERIERLEEEKAATADDIKQVYAEVKASGFDPKILRAVIKLRKMDSADRDEQMDLLGLYCEAIGFDYTPLSRAAQGLGRGDEE